MLVSRSMLTYFAALQNVFAVVWDFPSLMITLGTEIGEKRVLTVVHKNTSLVEAWDLTGRTGQTSFRTISQLEPLLESGEIYLTETQILWMLQESDTVPISSVDTLIGPLVDAITRIELGEKQLQESMRISADTVLRITAYEERGSVYVTLKRIFQPPGLDAVVRKFDFQIQFDRKGENPTVATVGPQIWDHEVPANLPFLTIHQQLELAVQVRRRF